ncbi:MAG: VWA domain-containing protein, partial [Ignavibacteriaceae bacterium]|nr:VWA domain-containing protein [Ignavibacteriaceae bacterium]
MKKLTYIILLMALSIFLMFLYGGCETAVTPVEDPNSDIPANPTGVVVPTPTKNNVQPTATFSPQGSRIKINLQGLIDPTTNQPLTLKYDVNNPQNSNIFVDEDGKVMGLKVTKVSSGNILKADIVFVVDNSGSMGQESDSVAASIIEFANFLQASGLDAKFGIVGYSSGIRGAINFTDAQSISAYLNRNSGTSRTRGFAGTDSASLDTRASTFGSTPGENGVLAAIFADSVFNWRSDAQRVFINFTDEPTQSDGSMWNNAMGCNLLGGKATVHTVFSQDSTYWNWTSTDERPWYLSLCSGGTNMFIPTNAAGLDLKNLPVAG